MVEVPDGVIIELDVVNAASAFMKKGLGSSPAAIRIPSLVTRDNLRYIRDISRSLLWACETGLDDMGDTSKGLLRPSVVTASGTSIGGLQATPVGSTQARRGKLSLWELLVDSLPQGCCHLSLELLPATLPAG